MGILGTIAYFLLMQAAATTPQTAKGTIEGAVVDARNGAPLPGVRVILSRASTQPPPGTVPSPPALAPPPPPPPPPAAAGGVNAGVGAVTSTFVFQSVGTVATGATGGNLPSATTDSQGRFVLKDVEAGFYRVTFAQNGYVKQDYGQRTFSGQGSPVNVVAGKALKDINMSMTQAGNLGGHIRDSSGAPAAGVPVQLLRATYTINGQRNYQTVTTDRTDDRGEYRLYWLSPGRYYLGAGTSAGPANRPGLIGGTTSPNLVPGESFALTFYPGVTNGGQAIGIDIDAAAEIGGIDFSVSRQQQLNVRGKVVDSRTGAAPAAVNIGLSYQTFDGGGSFGGLNNYNASTGTFELTNINPGSYTVTATLQDNTATDPASRARLATASMPVDVFNNDVENIVLNLVPGFPISGRIRVEGKPLPSLSGPRPQLRPSQNGVLTNTIGISTPASPTPDETGSFRVEGVRPGEYRISVVNLPPEYYLKDVRLNQIESLNQPMQFLGSDNALLDIVVSSGAVQIEGSVFDQKSMPEAGVTVVLIPDQHRDRSELFKNTTTDSNGKYTIRGIAPGDYKLFAWDSLDPFGWFDPDILRRDESKGKAIHVSESSNQNVDLRVIAP